MLRIHEVKLDLRDALDKIPQKIEKKLHIKSGEIENWKIIRESADVRKKREIRRVYTVDFQVKDETALIKKYKFLRVVPEESEMNFERRLEEMTAKTGDADERKPLLSRPVIIGFGPCGMFAALILAQAGYKPVVIERGKRIEDRIKDVELFWKEGKLNPKSNVQFGEGGAGAFSDGKLTSGIKNTYRTSKVLAELAAHGAPQEILYKHNPHVGTDILRKVVVSIRKEIERLGGEIRFESSMTGIIRKKCEKTAETENHDKKKDVDEQAQNEGSDANLSRVVSDERERLKAVIINNHEEIKTEVLIIAPGHSARDTFTLLYDEGFNLEAKPFSIGVRIEHPQQLVDLSQYGSQEAAKILGAADYKLSYKCKNGRGVYTFCMCPGGYVVASASEEGGVVTNGMSYHSRNGRNANSALLVGVNPSDFESAEPLAGVEFQRHWERSAFEAGGNNYFAPVQRVGDFMSGKPSSCAGKVIPEYKPGVCWTDVSQCLPEFATEAMREALPILGRKLKGFDMDDAVMTAVETRSSSPVRIVRNDELQTNVIGVYPAGEGAGYAGGIMSAAADGIRVAEKIIESRKRPICNDGACQ